MWKTCSKCGKVHPATYKCTARTIPATQTAEDRIRSTSRWQRKREEIKQQSQHLCAVCREEGRYCYEGIEVHHIVKLRDAPDLALENNNLIALCVAHHKMADRGELEVGYLKELAEKRDEEK